MREPKVKKRKRKSPPLGGKALERLHQFEQERGLEETRIADTERTKNSNKLKNATKRNL